MAVSLAGKKVNLWILGDDNEVFHVLSAAAEVPLSSV